MKLQDQLEQILQDLQLIGAETSLMLGAIGLLIIGLIFKQRLVHKLTFLGVLLIALYFNMGVSYTGGLLSNSMVITSQSLSIGSLILVFSAWVLLFPRGGKMSTEFYFLLLSLVVGSFFMMKSNSLLIAYLSIELVSFASYILTNFTLQKQAHESAIKYLIFGALSSIIMLFGIAFIYGAEGTIYISDWDAYTFNELISQVGLLFLVFGLFFKISIFPFHIWTPGVYQTAPSDSVAMMSVVPKLAGLVLLGRLLIDAGLSPDHWVIEMVLWSGIITMLVGTLGAMRQVNSRRMISFGAIAHSGFMLPLAITDGATSREAFWLYAVVYALMNLVIFYLVGEAEKQTIHKNKDYGYARKEIVIGVSLTGILISLVGLPPFAGFTAKFLLFSSLWESYELLGHHIYLIYLLIATLTSVVALFYYLRIPFNLFIAQEASKGQASIKFSNSTKFIATLFTIVLLLLFFVPELVMEAKHFLNNVHE